MKLHLLKAFARDYCRHVVRGKKTRAIDNNNQQYRRKDREPVRGGRSLFIG